MQHPEHCHLWANPEAVSPRRWMDQFEHLQTLRDSSHCWRYLLACKDCGQLYFHEFFETVDWKDGDDPQFWTWIPVADSHEADKLNRLAHFDLQDIVPRLNRDRPKGVTEPKIYWRSQ